MKKSNPSPTPPANGSQCILFSVVFTPIFQPATHGSFWVLPVISLLLFNTVSREGLACHIMGEVSYSILSAPCAPTSTADTHTQGQINFETFVGPSLRSDLYLPVFSLEGGRGRVSGCYYKFCFFTKMHMSVRAFNK
jgi:hypothetical protein